jgi:hypothetical protein
MLLFEFIYLQNGLPYFEKYDFEQCSNTFTESGNEIG